MKCPLFRAANIVTEPDMNWSGDDCLKEQCAWWSEEMEQCDSTGLIPWLKQIKEAIQDVRDNMSVARE